MGNPSLPFPDSNDVARLPLVSILDWYLRSFAHGDGHTARAKRLDLGHFLDFLKKHLKKPAVETITAGEWDTSACDAFLEDRLRRGESPATVSRRLATLKHMGRVLAERSRGFINPAREVKPPRVETLRPHALAPAELGQIRSKVETALASNERFSAVRNAALFTFLVETGLRVDEVRLLRRHQLSDDLDWISQVRTKGRRFRNVYISESARTALRRYLAARSIELARFFPKLSSTQDAKLPVFVSTHGATAADLDSFLMSPKTLWRAVRGMTDETRLHPHLLRHTFAIDLLESSRDVRLVAQALGHSDVRVTMRYTERTDEEIAKAIEGKSRKK